MSTNAHPHSIQGPTFLGRRQLAAHELVWPSASTCLVGASNHAQGWSVAEYWCTSFANGLFGVETTPRHGSGSALPCPGSWVRRVGDRFHLIEVSHSEGAFL